MPTSFAAESSSGEISWPALTLIAPPAEIFLRIAPPLHADDPRAQCVAGLDIHSRTQLAQLMRESD